MSLFVNSVSRRSIRLNTATTLASFPSLSHWHVYRFLGFVIGLEWMDGYGFSLWPTWLGGKDWGALGEWARAISLSGLKWLGSRCSVPIVKCFKKLRVDSCYWSYVEFSVYLIALRDTRQQQRTARLASVGGHFAG